MIHFDVNGSVLSVQDDTTISMELINPIFISDSDVIPGSYSLPFNVLNSSDNRKVLSYPDRVDRQNSITEWSDVTLYFDGKPILNGKLYLLKSSLETSSMTFIVNEFKGMSEVYLKDLDDLEKRNYEDKEEILAEMKDTAVFPENYNFATFPVLNPAFIDDEWAGELLNQVDGQNPQTGDIWQNYNDVTLYEIFNGFEFVDLDGDLLNESRWKRMFQNYWNRDTLEFEHDDQAVIVTPFVKVHYLVQKIFDHFDYRFLDGFFTTELKRLYLYNINSINGVDIDTNENVLALKDTYDSNGEPIGTELAIDLAENLPNAKALDLLKGIRSLFFITTVANPFKKTVKLVPIKEVIKGKVIFDWSSVVLVGYEDDVSDNLPKTFGYDVDSSDKMFELDENIKVKQNMVYEEESNNWINGWPQLFAGYNQMARAFMEFLDIETTGTKEPYLVKLIPLLNYCPQWIYSKILGYEWPLDYLPYPNAPIALIPGNITYVHNEAKITPPKNDDGSDNTFGYVSKNTSNDYSGLRLLFYRGVLQGRIYRYPPGIVIETDFLVQYPYASPTAFGPIQSRTISPPSNSYTPLPDDYSLLWNGDKGINDSWAKEYIDSLTFKSAVTYSLMLKLADIINFSFENKVRVHSNNYLVKSLTISFTKKGLQPTVATLVRVNQ